MLSQEELYFHVCRKLLEIGYTYVDSDYIRRTIIDGNSHVSPSGQRTAMEYDKYEVLEYVTAFERANIDDFYKPKSILASIVSDGAYRGRTFDLLNEPAFTLDQMHNLLNGRAVMPYVRSAAAYPAGLWFKIDFKKSDELGNPALDKYSTSLNSVDPTLARAKAGPSLERLVHLLSFYPLEENRRTSEFLRIVSGIVDGRAVEVTVNGPEKQHRAFIKLSDDLQSLDLEVKTQGRLVKVNQNLEEIETDDRKRRRGRSL